ncbi:MAG: protein-methionine-sulfoxide reductase catalytic subunit MsrP [Gemmatimonadetes bacterium]|nr:protein-methionine-sulfoxide reductase catalytic subunit MsrP [Gemmatimonadota bacterium]
MLIRPPADIPSSEITPEALYVNRRDFLGRAAGALAAASIGGAALAATARAQGDDDKPNTYEDITTYNNFYEFGTDKSDPAENAKGFKTRPWTVKVDGMVKKPAEYQIEDFLKPHKLEDRVYRHRCVEAWSMVIPWQGIPMAEVIKRFDPLPSAKFVQFQTLLDPQRMPGQQRAVLQWPYTEGLRLDEAMHPLAMFGTGIYGKTLLPQNGAPLRTIIPWKYGFKATKSIVRITFTDTMPRTTWNLAAPNEYGFYANVNPEVDHPRWTQSKERRIGEFRRRATLMFNGYPAVASLYRGMDLRANY